MSDIYPEILATELEQAKKENSELKAKLAAAEELLEEHGIAEKKHVPDEIRVLTTQIAKLAELNDKGVPFDLETVKILEILVKTLAVARGKPTPPDDNKPKKKAKTEPDVGKLLKLAEGNK